jgi:phosphoribosylaminoimidazole (AIR) synthetase
MRRTFNVGVGFVVVVAASDADRAVDALRDGAQGAFRLGTIVAVPPDRPFEERVEWPG